MLISLPLVSYLIALIVLSPVAGRLAERFTAKRTFIAALLPVAVSQVGLSISTGVGEFILWRGLAGAGYAVATIACQEYALRASAHGKHGRAMGGFVTVVIGGTFCGTALGGVLADRLGTSVTFLIGAALVVGSGIIASRMMCSINTPDLPHIDALTAHRSGSPLSNPRFVGLLFGVAIPANIIMASFLWYVVPLALADLGSRPADVGRVLMVYYLITVLVAPFVARLVDRGSGASLLIAAGGIISGLGLLGLNYWYGLWPIVAAVAAAGIGHAIIRATQVPLAIMISTKGTNFPSSNTLSALRMWERAGSVIGLLATGVLVGHHGYAMTISMIGALALAGTVIFAIIEIADALRPDT